MKKQTLRTLLVVLAGIGAVLAALSMIIGGEVAVVNTATILITIVVITALVTRMRDKSPSSHQAHE